jgi:outer membrane receptor protein involved in Fe transport
MNPAVAPTGINTIPGLTGASVTTAQNLLLDLSGSVAGASLTFNVHSPTDQNFTAPVRVKDYHQNEWGTFFKDDWKVLPSLTFNVGLRYDFYGVPWEKNGMNAAPVGGSAGLFGSSGTSIADMWQPGRLAGQPTQLQLTGKNSNHPDVLFYNNDRNNFGPALGLSWSCHGVERRPSFALDTASATRERFSFNAVLTFSPATTLSVNRSKLVDARLGATFLNFPLRTFLSRYQRRPA